MLVTAEDRQALWNNLDVIDCFATDHGALYQYVFFALYKLEVVRYIYLNVLRYIYLILALYTILYFSLY